MEKTWKGRFKKELDPDADKFNASISFDKRLFKYDVLAGKAHARALRKIKIITAQEMNAIISGLEKLLKNEAKIRFERYEDVHSAVEMELVKLIGETGKKLHTGRSRNDLVATDTRLYIKAEIKEVKKLLKNLMACLLEKASANVAVYMPGYTHLQHAQVVAAGHWLMAYFAMLRRDMELLDFAYGRADVMPLASGALAGSNYNLHRKTLAALLGFRKVSENSMDAVSDRDFVMDFLYFAASCAGHLSRLSEEIIIYSSNEFSLLEIDDSFATGSSIMPHKKNPDIAELVRGKAGIFYGNLMTGLTMVKGLPLAYNKDLQEDKPVLFRSLDGIKEILFIYEKFLRSISFNEERISEQLDDYFMYAVDLADYLVKKGMPFRESHSVIGKLVSYCIDNKKSFGRLQLEEMHKFSGLFGEDVFGLLSPERSTDEKVTPGSTSFKRLKQQIAEAGHYLASVK
ncbi:MAG TPA: argininosuccinate lyase [Candidatus Goldiibacteriota bacterium]|nr:argininosuccinate lyase [Candidatus Goldiibacteriota bacterium]